MQALLPVAKVAEKIIKANGLADNIKVVAKNSMNITIHGGTVIA